MSYVKHVLMQNLNQEAWWFLGVTIRTVNAKIFRNLLVIILWDLAVIERSLDWAFCVGALYLLCDLLEHVTQYWYNSSWMMGYNVTLGWVFAKWTRLPSWKVVDIETAAHYKGIVDLITSDYFGQNDYSVFVELVAESVSIVCMIIAPLLLFNVDFCSNVGEDGNCLLRDTISIKFEGGSFAVSLVVMMGNIGFVFAYFLIDHFSPSYYQDAVKRWLQLEQDFTIEVQEMLNDTPIHRLFKGARRSLEHCFTLMNVTRDQKFTFLLSLDASGRGYEWALTFLQIAIMMASPVLYGVEKLTIGQLQALFALVYQNRHTISRLSGSRERLRIAAHLVNELGELLNDGLELLIKETEYSQRQLQIVKHSIVELGVDNICITLDRVHYRSRINRDVYGQPLELDLDAVLPFGSVVGLVSPDPSHTDKASQQIQLQHQAIIDLIRGARTPDKGAVCLPQHLTVGMVPRQSQFVNNQSLLDNLCVGLDIHPPEETVWSLCRALGLPEHIFNAAGGGVPMCYLDLSPAQRQLVCIARAMLTMPDILLVHDSGVLDPHAAGRVGAVLELYSQGMSLSRLARLGARPRSDAPVERSGASPSAAELTELRELQASVSVEQSSVDDNLCNASPVPRATVAVEDVQVEPSQYLHEPSLSHADRIRLQPTRAGWERFAQYELLERPREAAVAGRVDQRTVIDDELLRRMEQGNRRTVVWHSTSNVLLHASVHKAFSYRNGKLLAHTLTMQEIPLHEGPQADLHWR